MRRPSRVGLFVLGAVATVAAGCTRGGPAPEATATAATPKPAAPWFEEVAAARGLPFRYESGHRDLHLMPEMAGGGVALFDMEGDGDLDVYFVQGGSIAERLAAPPTNRLFANRGDGTFEDVSEGSGADIPGYGMGVACGDADADGDVDLFVSRFGRNAFLRNEGKGRFLETTDEAGLAHEGWSTSAAFFDADRDGDLDLYVASYIRWSHETEIPCKNDMGAPDYCGPKTYDRPAVDAFYRNRGDGTFDDATKQAGLEAAFGNGLGVVCGDFDGDGWTDVFVANDGSPNQLWINQGDGTFVDRALITGCALDERGSAKAGMGVAAEDIDDDGDLDLLVGNLFRETDSLFRWEGRFFSDVTAKAGLAATTQRFTRFGLGWFDFDNDGHLDLFEANGRVLRYSESWSTEDPYAEPPSLFRGLRGGTFEDVEPRGGVEGTLLGASRGAAFGDVDGDGGVDVVVVNRDGPAWLLRNVVRDRGHWISIRCVDPQGRDAIGAIVRLGLGDRRLRREVRAAKSYCSSSDPRVHVGLGGATSVTAVEVTWPDGTRESFGDLAADRVVTLSAGQGGARMRD